MNGLTSAGLFAGIGGTELGLERAGFRTQLLCELDPAAAGVLASRFPEARLVPDVRRLRCLPSVDGVCAGFPCQDLSQAGRTAGIGGDRSGLVDEIFRLLARKRSTPTWLLVQNVPFMLHLDRGRAMAHITQSLCDLGFSWASFQGGAKFAPLPRRPVALRAGPIERQQPGAALKVYPRLEVAAPRCGPALASQECPPSTRQQARLLEFACPRCSQSVTERFFGPCSPCRDELRAQQRGGANAGTMTGPARFEPKMNVVPNHVATKDD